MHNGYRGILAATWLFILLAVPAAAKPQNHHPSAQELDLYSQRALRRTRTILQLKLLELREERLACVHEVLERRLPPELLWDPKARKRYRGKKPACLNEGSEL